MMNLLRFVYGRFLQKNFIKPLSLVVLSSILCVVGGCSNFIGRSDSKVNYFDIGYPPSSIESNVLKEPVVIGNFDSTSPFYERMVFRTSERYQKIDDYNRWSSTPSQMLKRYFILALEGKNIEKIDKEKEYLELDANILSLEADIQKKIVTLILKIDITYGKNETIEYSKIINVQEKLDEITANQFAEALRKAVDKAVKESVQALLKVESMSNQTGIFIEKHKSVRAIPKVMP
jgi:ABC-type uncharacterized transport system auxiliary subunit